MEGMSAPHPVRTVVTAVAVVLVLILAVTGGMSLVTGSRQASVLPPSPQQYAQAALTEMEAGLHARGGQWQAARERALQETASAATIEETWPALARAVEVAGGTGSRLIPADAPRVTEAQPMPTATTGSGITTLTMPTLSADGPPFTQQYADQGARNVQSTLPATTCGWIVDLRGHRGGDLHPVLVSLGPVLPDDVVAGLLGPGTRTTFAIDGRSLLVDGREKFATYREHPKAGGPVAVLIGPHTSGSGELAAIALTSSGRAESFGEPTAGLTVHQQRIRLRDGSVLLLGVARYTGAHGDPVDGPVTPDVQVPVAEAPEAAAAWLRSQCR